MSTIRRVTSAIMALTFLSGIYRGYIAIWQTEDPQPKWVLPYSADLLPQKDRLTLSQGIRLHSREDLTRFLEDYCS